MKDIKYMEIAIELAKIAYTRGDVPIGCVIVKEDIIVGRGYNTRVSDKSPTGHAEINALEEAGAHLKSWNLEGCTLYVTLEPCLMCAGAIMQSRITNVVYGASEPKSGCFGSVMNILEVEGYNHYPEVTGMVLKDESEKLMKQFFNERRKENIKIRKVATGEFSEYLAVRKEIFVKEQGVSIDEEYDSYDTLEAEGITHIGAFIDGTCVGTMRLIKKDDSLKVGRLAVLKNARDKKIGSKLLQYAYKQAVNNGYSSLILDAQCQAIPFYEKQGYVVNGPVFLDAGIEHKNMVLKIKN